MISLELVQKSIFTERQVILALQENKADRSVEEMSRELSTNNDTFCNWRTRSCKIEIGHVNRLKVWKMRVEILSECLLMRPQIFNWQKMFH